ncbi:MFS transporter [Halogeometricum borinquense]|uniref:MFS transporter n=2 Tax=Halogeometricum borinquense TaxID=60847 RepID=A0A6C0UPH2_9EURY|nr:MFS transporter [Halogeometricum borinquense]QIQ76278.1 MFS transporter [Halogeometricum borinquense]
MNRNDRSIVALVMLAHGMVHTYELSLPIFVTIWLMEFDVVNLGLTQLEVTAATLGWVLTAGYGLFGIGALPGGVLVDRIGSRRLISLCLFGMAGSFVLLGLSPNLVVVTLALLCWGAAASVYHPAGLALISKGMNERGTGFAYHGIAGNVGIGLGPLLTAILLVFLDWTTVAMLLSVPALAAGAYATRAKFDESAAVDAGAGGSSKADAGVDSFAEFVTESKRLIAGGLAVVFLVVICSGLFYRGVLTFLPDLLSGLDTFDPIPLASLLPAGLADALGVEAGSGRMLKPERYFYSGLLMVGVLGQYAGGKLTDRLPVEWGLVGAFGALAVLAVLFLPVVNAGIAPLLVFGAILGFFLFVIQPFYQATVAEYTPAGTRGLSYGYTYLGVFGVGALGGALAGTILTYATPTALFTTLAGIAVAGALFGFYLARKNGAATGSEVTSD